MMVKSYGSLALIVSATGSLIFGSKELLYYGYAPLPANAATAVNARKVGDLSLHLYLLAINTCCAVLYLATMNSSQ